MEAIRRLRTWLNVEESDARQKARVTWLQLGDDNTHYFHNVMKERRGRNRIVQLEDENDNNVDQYEDIERVVVNFYKRLLGSREELIAIDPRVVARGPIVNREDALELIREVTKEEVDKAMFSIQDEKAPGIDGYNAKFFKVHWDILKEEIYFAIFEFFKKGVSLSSWNCTLVTLIPKVSHATKVKDFRPISCCSVLYKIIAKILASRLQNVIQKIVSQAQTGFIPGRHIVDNVILASEIIKGYSFS